MVSIIVVNHNRAALLRQCLVSVLEQTYGNLEVIVVDNGSTDGSLEVARSFADSRLRVMALDRNLGFAAPNNRGIRQARGEFIALLNNDAVADTRWIEELMAVITRFSHVGMCASKILFSGTRIIDKVGHRIYFDGQNRGRGTGELDQGQYERVEEALFPDGCAAIYRTSMLYEVGDFDESFFAYADDADLGLRCRWMGYGCLYVPRAVVFHHHSATSGPYAPQKIFWVERNRLWLAAKSFPWPLLLVSPFLTFYRWCWNLVAALARRGPAGHFRRRHSLTGLLMVVVRAHAAGICGLGRVFTLRKALRKRRRISSLDFCRLLWKFRLSARTLAFQDVDEDFCSGRTE